MAEDEDDNPWFPLIGDMNPMTMPFGGFRMNRSLIGNGANQMKSGLEWIMDQSQDALPTFPVEAIALKVIKTPPEKGLIPNFWGIQEKPPIRVVCYIPEMHAVFPMWKSESTKDLSEEDRINNNNKILDMISSGGGLFLVEQDSPENEDVGVTAGDKLLVDYKDRKNLSGGRVSKILQRNVANNLPPEWKNPVSSAATPVDPKATFNKGDSSPLGDVLNPQVPPNSSLIIPPATYDDELLDPDIPSRYRPFLHPLNGLGLIASAAPIRNDKSNTHFGLDLGWKGNPIYAMADGYVSRSTQPPVPLTYEKKYVSDRHTSYAKGELKTDANGKTYIEELKGMSSACGWICEIIHWDGTSTNKHSVNRQGHGANQENGYGTRYMHMVAPPLVKKGQRVTRGQIIGYVGGTPFFAPHLHIEVVYKGLYSDPSPYMYMDIDAIAMIEYGGLGIDKQPAGSDFGYIRKYGTYKGKRKGYNYRIGKFIIGQQLVWPKDRKNPTNPSSTKQWYAPVKGNPLTSGATVYQVAQIENSAAGDNSDGKDTANELTPDISNIPQQARPESGEK